MSTQEIKTNYHSALSGIKDILDPVLTKMTEQLNEPWHGKAWKAPITTVKGLFGQAKVLKGLSLAQLPIIGPTAAGIFAGIYGPWAIWMSILGAILLSFGIYYLLVRNHIGKMATIGHPQFHVEVYKARRRSEYLAVWAPVLNHRITFNGLYDMVNAVFSQAQGDPQNLTSLVSYTHGQHEFMQKTMSELKETIGKQEDAIESLNAQLISSENAVTYLIDLLKKVSENLYRFVNGRLDLSDMNFVSGFSIYRKVENKLEFLMDKETSGRSRTLDLDVDEHYAAVIAAKDEQGQAIFNNPYPGRFVVAFRMLMLNDEVWVWCFHFDDDDERALSLTLASDIIETRQIRRLVHAFCLTIQSRMLSMKEDDLDEAVN